VLSIPQDILRKGNGFAGNWLGLWQCRKTRFLRILWSCLSFKRSKYQELYSLGYLAPKEFNVKSNPDSVWLRVNTGERFTWVTLGQGNVDPVLLVKTGVDLKRFDGRPFDYKQISRIFESILHESENKGYPFAAIRLDSLKRSGNGFAGALDYNPGPKITFDSLKFTGDTKTKPEFLSRFLQIKPGELFHRKK
jgi:outer membrane protein assembly factor BamA